MIWIWHVLADTETGEILETDLISPAQADFRNQMIKHKAQLRAQLKGQEAVIDALWIEDPDGGQPDDRDIEWADVR